MISRNWLLVAAAALALGHTAKAQVPAGPPRNLTPDTVSGEMWLRLNSTGTKVTYTQDAGVYNGTNTWADVYACDLDGSNRQRTSARLKATEEHGVASPDGTKVVLHAFSSLTANASGATDIWVYDLVTGAATQMTTNTAYDAYPSWSPDGTKIAFISQRSHDDNTQDYQVWVMNADKPENTTDNIPVQLSNFKGPDSTTKGTGVRVSFMDNDHVLFLGKSKDISYVNTAGTTVYPMEIFQCEARDQNGDKFGDNMVRLTDTGTLKKTNNNPCVVYDPGYAMGRVFFWSDLCADGQWHFFSLDPSGVNKDVWQVTCANYGEDYGLAQGNHLAFRINHNDTDGLGIGIFNKDAGIYDLVADVATPNSTITGKLICQVGQPQEGALVTVYNGATAVASTLTDANGVYSISGLRAGGYYVKFTTDPNNTTQMPFSTVSRGCVVAPDGTTTVNAFTSPSAAPRPGIVMATIDGTNVVVNWQPPAESTNATTGFTYQGFNIWRADSEAGPYTKINTELVPKSTTGINRYVDVNPPDLGHAFYKVTSVTTSIDTAPNGAQTLESMFAEFAQAANNLVYNGSYEVASATPSFAGWLNLPGTVGTPAQPVDNVWSADATDFVVGSQSLALQAGALRSGSTWVHDYVPQPNGLNVFYCIPTSPGEAYVSGSFVRFKDVTKTSTNTYAYTALAYAYTEPCQAIPAWYDSTYRSNQINGPTTGNTSIPWTWMAATATARAYEFATYTRFSTVISLDNATCTGTTAKALMDDAHYQVKRIGATGTVWGHVVDGAGNGVGGVKVSDGTRFVYSDIGGIFALRNVPTGMATITFNYPGQTEVTRTVLNMGGYCFQDDIKYTATIPLSMGGYVYLPNGQPAAGARVHLINSASTPDGNEAAWDAITGPDGSYTFDFSAAAPDYTKRGWFVASKAGYGSAVSTNRTLLGYAGKMMFNFTLGIELPIVEIAKTATAPVIDGTVNPSEWSKSAVIPLAYKFPTSAAPSVAANAYALWDNDALYLAVVANEPDPASMVLRASGKDGSVLDTNNKPIYTWGDDHAEILIDPTAGGGYGQTNYVWHMGVNPFTAGPNGLGYDDGTFRTGPLALADVNYAEDIPSFYVADPASSNPAAKIGADKWSVEMRIPFSDFAAGGALYPMMINTPNVGDEWRGLIARYRPADGENSSTSILSGGFVNAPLYNTWRFVNTITPPAVKGDLTGDSQVTLLDVQAALRIAAGIDALGSRLAQGDVVADSKVNLQDAVRILRKVDGLDTAW